MYFKPLIILTFLCSWILTSVYSQCNPVTLQIENDFRSNTSSDKGYNAYSLNGTDYYFEGNDTLIDLAHVKSIWFGGMDDEKYRLAANTSKFNERDYYPGPLNATTGEPYILNYCHTFPKIWKFSKEEISNLQSLYASNDLQENDLSIYIKSYPAKNNIWYQDNFDVMLNEDLAPFYDRDGDGNYDPLNGDYPIPIAENPDFIPHQFTYSIYNDAAEAHSVTQASRAHVEIQQISYLLSESNDPILDKTLFTRFIWTLKGPYSIRNASLGIYELQDLDVNIDDYFGIDTLSNSWYIYNKDDGQDQYTGSTNIRFTTCLNATVDNFMVYNFSAIGNPIPQITDPILQEHYYNYMNGLWKDGTPLTIGGNGYNASSSLFTNYAFHDSPKDSTGWSMQSENLPFGSFTTVSSFQLGDLENGDSGIIDLSDIILYDEATNGFDKLCQIQSHSNLISSFYDEHITKGGSTTTNDIETTSSINVYPNPASSILYWELDNQDEKPEYIQILDINGRTLIDYKKNEFSEIDISGLQSGTYLLVINTSNSVHTHRFVKI